MAKVQIIRSHPFLKQLSCFLILAHLCNLPSLPQQLQKKSVGHSVRTNFQPKHPTITIIIPITMTIQQVPYKNFNEHNPFRSSELTRNFLFRKNRENFNKFQYSVFAALISTHKSRPKDQEYTKVSSDNTSKIPSKRKFEVYRFLRYKEIRNGERFNSCQYYLPKTGRIAPISSYASKDSNNINTGKKLSQILRYSSPNQKQTNISCNHISISGSKQIIPYFIKQRDTIISTTHKSISTDAKKLNQPLASIGLPDFLKGPA